jgi:ankyrin repeat protein
VSLRYIHQLHETNSHSILIKDFDLVRWLLAKGADPNALSESGDTPLSLAITQSPIHVIKILIGQALCSGSGLCAGELAYCAVQRYKKDRNLEVLRTLIEAGAPFDDILWDKPPAYNKKAWFHRGTPLHEACKHGLIEVVELLVGKGANPNKYQRYYDSDSGSTPLHEACKHGFVEVAETLVKNGANPNKRMRCGDSDSDQTALEIVRRRRDTSMLEMMSKYGF